MREVEEILELLKGKPYSVGGLKAYSKLSEEKVQAIVSFMQKQDLIEVHSNEITITESGLEFLNLSPDSEVTKSASLYTEKTKETSVKEREEMADRYGIETDDVEHAAWMFAKDLVGVKLRRDLQEKKKKGKEK